MLNRKDIFQRVSVAMLAQLTVLLASLFASLIAPKFLGVTEFGYWQLFMLYGTYAGLFHFGLNDGVYLLNGGRSRQDVDRSSLTAQFLIGVALQLLIAATFFSLATLLVDEPNRRFVLQMFAVYVAGYNMTAYLGYVFQALNETKAYSVSVMVSRVAFVGAFLAILTNDALTYRWMIIAFVGGQYLSLIFSLFYARGAMLGKPLSLRGAGRAAFASIRAGMWLMAANLANLFLLGSARFIIDFKWGIETFGQLSLVFLMVSFVLLFVSQVSMVLFPALRRLSGDEVTNVFIKLRDLFTNFIPVIYALYFPVFLLISAWLPDYKSGLMYLAAMFPIAGFSACMDVCYTTFFKVLRQERTLLVVNVLTLAASAAVSLFGAYALDSIWVIVLGLVVVICGRMLVAEWLLRREANAPVEPFVMGNVVMAAIFVLTSMYLPFVVAACSYSIALAVFYVLRWKLKRS